MKRLFILFALALATSASATTDQQERLASAALAQVGVTRIYDSSYASLKYPGGDIPMARGVCADVVVRSFRRIGVDLQRSVHEDMESDFRAYPHIWGLQRPDPNIDHRRVPNLMKFFERKGKSVDLREPYEPGDVVAWMLPDGHYHIGVVSNVRGPDGVEYLVVHNIGFGALNEPVLHAFRIIGHYRW